MFGEPLMAYKSHSRFPAFGRPGYANRQGDDRHTDEADPDESHGRVSSFADFCAIPPEYWMGTVKHVRNETIAVEQQRTFGRPSRIGSVMPLKPILRRLGRMPMFSAIVVLTL